MENTTDLEGNDGDGNHARPYHGESILPSQKARVEKANARNHGPDEGRAGQSPCDVSRVVNDGITLIIDPVQITGYVSCEQR